MVCLKKRNDDRQKYEPHVFMCTMKTAVCCFHLSDSSARLLNVSLSLSLSLSHLISMVMDVKKNDVASCM